MKPLIERVRKALETHNVKSLHDDAGDKPTQQAKAMSARSHYRSYIYFSYKYTQSIFHLCAKTIKLPRINKKIN